MSFPWKKSKITRVSRLVAGFHKTPKRGGSLVVETGFPTSLIDLFVKNRDRLRRSSERKPDPTRSHHSPTRSAGNRDARESDSIERETDDSDDEKKKKKNRIELEDEQKMETELTRKQGTERTRSARIRSSLIKKFVPKKLRYRNEKNQGKSEKEKHLEEEEEEEEEETESGTESETELKTELIIVPTTTKFDRNNQNLMTQSAEKEKNLIKGNLGHVIPFVLVLVVLVGLIGGRGVALLLTLLCYSTISICFRTPQINVDSNNGRKIK